MTGEDDPSTDSKRRDFLKAMSAAGLAGMVGFAGNAGASTPNRTITEVTGARAKRLAALARRSEEFRALEAELTDRPGVTIDHADVGVLRVTEDGGDSWHVVDFAVEDGRDDTQGDIAVTVHEGAALGASASITRMADGAPVEIEAFEVDGGAVRSEVAAIPGDAGEQDVSALYTVCDFCQDVFYTACSLGCDWGTSAICASLGLSVVGGIACAIVAEAVCWYIEDHGCSPGAEWACTELDYC